jgi:hypothetical protein
MGVFGKVTDLSIDSKHDHWTAADDTSCERRPSLRVEHRKHDLVACIVVRNESRYIYEWLSFHYYVGIKHFYIYENCSTDDTIKIIKSWPKQDLLTLINWPVFPAQPKAFEHFLETSRDVAEWCAFIDCDEFLCPRTPEPIPEFLCSLDPGITGIYVHWLTFGSSGYRERANGLVTETFTMRCHENFGPNCHGKTIARLHATTSALGTHIVASTGRLVNDSFDEVDQAGSPLHVPASHRKVALHHYFTKSLEEWRLRRRLGRVDLEASDPLFIRSDEDFYFHDVNDVVDVTAANLMREARKDFLLRPPSTLPEDFVSARYLALHPDVAAAGVDAREHYLCHGFFEGRRWKSPEEGC